MTTKTEEFYVTTIDALKSDLAEATALLRELVRSVDDLSKKSRAVDNISDKVDAFLARRDA